MAVATSPTPPSPGHAIASPRLQVDARASSAGGAAVGCSTSASATCTLHRSTELLRTRLDDAIPFWPWTSWFYLPVLRGVFIIAIAASGARELFNRALARSVLSS